MKEKIEELGYAIVKAGVGSIPLAGGVLSELFSVAFSDPASKRREKVLLEMDERLQRLELEGFDIQKLSESEEFLTIALQVYNIALRTHHEGKRLALMNSMSNTPKLTIDENIKLMYLSYIDEFNEWHLRILSFLDKPSNHFNDTNKPNFYSGSKLGLLSTAYPELSSQKEICKQIANDLYSKGLIVYNSLTTTLSEQGLWQSGTSDFGRQFLRFISE